MTDYTIRDIPKDLWRKVKSEAALDDSSIKDYIIKTLREKVEGQQQDQQKQDAS